MPKTFISYRRQDSLKIVRHIYARLETEFGDENVFWDKRDLLPGQKFPSELYDAILDCDVFLAVIGQGWCKARGGWLYRRRLFMPSDFVRLEVETALYRKKRVIPVLVNGAAMPQTHHLPESLQPLAFRQAVTVREDLDYFAADMDVLIQQIRQPPLEDDYGDSTLGGFRVVRPQLPWELLVMLLFVLIVSGALVVVSLYRFNGFVKSSSPNAGTGQPALPPITASVPALALIPDSTPEMGPNVRLWYTRQVFYLINESDTVLDVSHLRFEQTYPSGKTRVFHADEWDKIYGIRGSSSAMKVGGCYELVAPNSSWRVPDRGVCEYFLGWYRPNRSALYFWWTLDPDAAFTVWSDYADAPLAECSIAAGQCAFTLVN